MSEANYVFGAQPVANPTSNRKAAPDAYINAYLPRSDGERGKLGAFSLSMSKEDQADLINGLNSGVITVEQIKEHLVLDFRMAVTTRAKFTLAK